MTAVQEYRPLNGTPASRVSQATAIEQSRAVAEVQAAVIVAQNVPRDIQRAIAEMRESCGRMAMAEQAFYQVPNRGTGPSVHLMRELARIWGNIEHGSHELRRDAAVSEVQAFAWDKQTNTRTSRTFIAPHERMKGGGRQRLTDLGDIQNNNNNVAARAVRECISNVLPRWFTEEAQNVCRRTLEHGEGEPLDQRIERMVKAFHDIGVTQRQIESRVGKSRGQWGPGDVAQMGIVYTSITRDGYSKEEVFPPVQAGTVDELVGDTAARAKKPRGGSRVRAVEPVPGGGGQNDVGDGAELSSGTARDQEPPAEPTGEPPGGVTDATPGQTDRVAKALAKASKGGVPAAPRRTLAEDIAAHLEELGCRDDADQLAVIGHVLGKAGEFSTADLTDNDVKKVRDILNAWRQLGTGADMAGRILDAADLNAEQGEQQTLDETTE
ncbi:hypothetical protein [Mycobacterium kansasii]|uniref:hypothetical protein n=1 Tax=Mycobacterium kansasii TaxID=1768 RepID=UPI0015E441B2|nr:hypothetical protein [Mycobacterium kansasii]